MDKFDIAIIGSGLGGLICGYILSKEGYSVCIIEKNVQIGGSLQNFVRDRCIFDTGAHYAGGLDEGQNLYKFFKYFGLIGKLKMRRLDEDAFDIISFGDTGEDYRFAMGYDRFYQTLLEKFPKEKEALTAYCDKLKEISNAFPLYNLRDDIKPFMEQEYYKISAGGFIESITQDKRLRNVLAGTNLLYAGLPDKTPLYIHSLINSTYIESAWRFVDGSSQIARLLARSIKEQGGRIFTRKEVSRFIFENSNIESLELTDGSRIEAKYFISNLHPSRTLEMIDFSKIRKTYRSRINELENTISIFTTYMILKNNSFNYINSNYYCYRGDNAWAAANYDHAQWPESYMLLTSANSKSVEFAESITAMSYMKYNEVNQWEGTIEGERGEDYERFKQEKAERQIDFIERKFPGLRSHIVKYYTSTPLTYRDYIGTKDGSLYGIQRDCNDPLKSLILPRTKIPNLFFTGQNVNLHGILGVTIGAILTCAEFLGLKYLLGKINESN
ncbi:MAG: all-trans-retinol 13,14-reductase [Bacteroidota bacterium]|nr:all-trans-retinol 13,14-reductase [Bacteroidota bacterium]